MCASRRRGSALCLMMLTGSAVLLPPTGHAAPALQMHVFDAPGETPATVQPRTADTGGLKLHVFDHSTAGRDSYHSPSVKPRQPARTPPLAYERADVYLKTGYRRDKLDWNKAGPGGYPNVLSELKWRDLDIATISAGATLYTQGDWLFSVDALYGRIYDGKNQDSDYLGNNRTLEFSRSNNGADEGDVMDLSLSVGYRLPWQPDPESGYLFEFRPQLGLSYHQQNLKVVDGYQTLSAIPGFTPPVGPFPGLDSSYEATWFGPWIGLDSQLMTGSHFRLGLNLEYHYAFYDATADWNLRTDLAHPESFTHEAEGYGLVSALTAAWQLTPSLALTLDLSYQKWKADRNGKDKMYFADGSTYKLKFNEANWTSRGASIGLQYDF